MEGDTNPHELYADELTKEDVADLAANFNCCGDNTAPWALAANEWILGSDKWESINRGSRVWLYRTEQGMLVGFGSLGKTRRRWPPPNGGYKNILIIPQLGIDYRCQGKPAGYQKFSHQIMSHLIHEAEELYRDDIAATRTTLNLLTLFVHEENRRAIRLYENFGFVAEPAAAREHQLLMTLTLEGG